MARKKGIPGVSFSAKRAFGVPSAKRKISRAAGIPTSRSGRQQKTGKMMGCAIPFVIMLISVVLILYAFL